MHTFQQANKLAAKRKAHDDASKADKKKKKKKCWRTEFYMYYSASCGIFPSVKRLGGKLLLSFQLVASFNGDCTWFIELGVILVFTNWFSVTTELSFCISCLSLCIRPNFVWHISNKQKKIVHIFNEIEFHFFFFFVCIFHGKFLMY